MFDEGDREVTQQGEVVRAVTVRVVELQNRPMTYEVRGGGASVFVALSAEDRSTTVQLPSGLSPVIGHANPHLPLLRLGV